MAEHAIEVEFPAPFSGIDRAVSVARRSDINKIAKFMANGCGEGHAHNVAFQFDGNVIWTTELGVQCVYRALGVS